MIRQILTFFGICFISLYIVATMSTAFVAGFTSGIAVMLFTLIGLGARA